MKVDFENNLIEYDELIESTRLENEPGHFFCPQCKGIFDWDRMTSSEREHIAEMCRDLTLDTLYDGGRRVQDVLQKTGTTDALKILSKIKSNFLGWSGRFNDGYLKDIIDFLDKCEETVCKDKCEKRRLS